VGVSVGLHAIVFGSDHGSEDDGVIPVQFGEGARGPTTRADNGSAGDRGDSQGVIQHCAGQGEHLARADAVANDVPKRP
jgi:hypothetical protein